MKKVLQNFVGHWCWACLSENFTGNKLIQKNTKKLDNIITINKGVLTNVTNVQANHPV